MGFLNICVRVTVPVIDECHISGLVFVIVLAGTENNILTAVIMNFAVRGIVIKNKFQRFFYIRAQL